MTIYNYLISLFSKEFLDSSKFIILSNPYREKSLDNFNKHYLYKQDNYYSDYSSTNGSSEVISSLNKNASPVISYKISSFNSIKTLNSVCNNFNGKNYRDKIYNNNNECSKVDFEYIEKLNNNNKFYTYKKDLLKYNVKKDLIIGIVTNPYPINSNLTNLSTIDKSYIEWLESVGFKCMPILFDYDYKKLDNLLSLVDGLLFQGGDRNLIHNGLFEAKCFYILDKCIDLKLPVWLTCQGFEILHWYFSKDINVLEEYSAWGVTLSNEIVTYNLKYPKLFSEYFNSNKNIKLLLQYYINEFNSEMHLNSKNNFLIEIYKQFNINKILSDKDIPSSIHYHNYGISLESYFKFKELRQNLKITSFSYDLNNKKFINTVESIDFSKHKFFGVQFHPECSLFDYDEDTISLSNINSIVLSQNILLAFKNEVYYYSLIKEEFDIEQLLNYFDNSDLSKYYITSKYKNYFKVENNFVFVLDSTRNPFSPDIS